MSLIRVLLKANPIGVVEEEWLSADNTSQDLDVSARPIPLILKVKISKILIILSRFHQITEQDTEQPREDVTEQPEDSEVLIQDDSPTSDIEDSNTDNGEDIITDSFNTNSSEDTEESSQKRLRQRKPWEIRL